MEECTDEVQPLAMDKAFQAAVEQQAYDIQHISDVDGDAEHEGLGALHVAAWYNDINRVDYLLNCQHGNIMKNKC